VKVGEPKHKVAVKVREPKHEVSKDKAGGKTMEEPANRLTNTRIILLAQSGSGAELRALIGVS
jgi:hypothetical protein